MIVYGLRDPRTQEIRYVGQTIHNVEKRLKEHLRDKEPSYKSNWIQALKKAGLVPEVVRLEVCQSVSDLFSAEERWISIGRLALGDRLTNATDGGMGNRSKRSPATCSRMSKAWTPARREGQRQRALKVAQLNKGRVLSSEHREKLSLAARARAPELAKHFATINRGRVHTKEHVQKLVEARRIARIRRKNGQIQFSQ